MKNQPNLFRIIAFLVCCLFFNFTSYLYPSKPVINTVSLTWNFDNGGIGDPGGGAISSDPTMVSSDGPPEKYKGFVIDNTCLFESIDYGSGCHSDYTGDKSLAVCNWPATLPDFYFDPSYLEFCFDINADYPLNVTEISFDMGRSADGPDNVWVTKAIEVDVSGLLDNTSPKILGTHYQSSSDCNVVNIPVSGVTLEPNTEWCFYIYLMKDNDPDASYDCESAGPFCRRVYLDDVLVILEADFCQDDLIQSGTIAAGNYQVSDFINSTGTIYSPSVVDYRVGNNVCLDQNFTVKSGAELNVIIEDCNP